MTLEEFNKERDERAEKSWNEAWKVWREGHPSITDSRAHGFLIQWCLKEIASTQIMVEKLVEHTKLPPLGML